MTGVSFYDIPITGKRFAETDPVKITDLVAPLAKKFCAIAGTAPPRIS
jgi:hypothetical protein